MQKTKRLLAIEKIITELEISSQEVLIKKLKAKGIICTQATLSRDLRQLGASRIPDGRGGYRYALIENQNQLPARELSFNIISVIREIVEAKGLMIIKTIPGNANATAYYIDNAGRYEIAGTVAGDDTILLIPRDGSGMKQIHTSLELIFPGLHEQIRKKE